MSSELMRRYDESEEKKTAKPAISKPAIDIDALIADIKLFDSEGKKKSQSTILIEIANNLTVFHDAGGNGYAIIEHRPGFLTVPIGSGDFRRWLSARYWKLIARGCNAKSITEAVDTILAKAIHECDCREIYQRVANTGDRLFIDIGDDKFRVIEITKAGWRVLDRSPVHFVRKSGMTSLPMPTAGNIEKLRPFLNLPQDGFELVVAWLIGSLRGSGPFPILVLQGEQGTGKSTTSRILRGLIDPSAVPLRAPQREVRDMLVSAQNNYLFALDNLSGINPEQSDVLCRLATGGGFDARKLYTDDEQILVDIQRPIIVNGIDEIASRPDLANRSIILHLPVIADTQRQVERNLIGDFDRAAPGILGALLDGVSAAIRGHESVKLGKLPRMADFATWAAAGFAAYGWEKSVFIDAYAKNQNDSILDGIESSPLGSALITLLKSKTTASFKPTELLGLLAEEAGNGARSRAWPQSPKGLKNSLARLAPNLRHIGISYTQDASHDRLYQFTCNHSNAFPNIADKPPQVPQVPQASNGAGFGMGVYGADTGHIGADTGGYPPHGAVENSIRPGANPITARVGADRAVGAVISTHGEFDRGLI